MLWLLEYPLKQTHFVISKSVDIKGFKTNVYNQAENMKERIEF